MTLTEFLLARIADDEEDVADDEPWDGGMCQANVGVHYSRDRVLAECEAKRRIVEQVSDVTWVGSYAVRDFVLGQLVLPYADHPDFREEWRV